MKDTILHKLLKWVIASSVSLLALPISVFVIIFSLYPDLTTVNDFNIYKLKRYYEICDISIKDTSILNKNSDTLFTNTTPKIINKKHLLVIDQTLSTVFEGIGLDILKKNLRLSIKGSTLNKIDKDSIKSLICAKLIESFDLDNNCDSLFVYFYNGNINPDTSWIEVSKDAFTPKLLNYLDHSVKIEAQKTDFREIFKTVQGKIIEVRNIKKNIEIDCITFLSDFYHEPKNDLIDLDFINFKKVSKNIKINLIALWNTTYIGKDSAIRVQRQNNFIAKFDEYFLGVVATEKLFIDKYKNSSYTNPGDFLEFEEIITYKPPKEIERNDNDSSIVTFFSQLSNSLKYDEAQVKIMLNTKKSFHWKIKSIFNNNNTFIRFNRNCDTKNTNKCRLNQWYEDECDSLLLKIKLEHDLNLDDLKFCYVFNKDSINKFEEYDIKIKKIFIEQKQKEILTVICNIFCILLIIILIAGEWLFCLYFFDYKQFLHQHSLKSLMIWVLGMVLIGVLLCLLFYIAYSVYLLPIIILIIIVFMLTGKLRCWLILRPHIKRKRQIFYSQFKKQRIEIIKSSNVFRRSERYARKEKSKLFINNIKERIGSKRKVFNVKRKSYINMIKETIQNMVLNIKNKIHKK